MCLYIEQLLTMLSCNFFVDFSWSLKHCSAWEESQIWQLPKLQAFLSLITYMLTHDILLKDSCVMKHIWCTYYLKMQKANLSSRL